MLVQWLNTVKLCVITMFVVLSATVAGAKVTGDGVEVWSLQPQENMSTYSRVTPVLVEPELLRDVSFSPSSIINIEQLDTPFPQKVVFTTGHRPLPSVSEVEAALDAAMIQNISYVSRKVEATPGVRTGAMVTWPVLLLAAGIGFLAWSGRRRKMAADRAEMLFGRGEI